jgi:DNA-binding HxlR family transcriptional regulator
LTYGEYCSIARTLDVVGDRWTLLLVRELLARPARFTELRSGLPGIAPNLLSQRLKALQEHGVVERRLTPDAVVYALTEWGEGLREPLAALARWGAPLMRTGRGTDSFRPHWLLVALEALLVGVSVRAPVRVRFDVEGESLDLLVDERGPHATMAGAEPADVTVTAPGDVVVATMSHNWSLGRAEAAGARISGNRAALEAVLAV